MVLRLFGWQLAAGSGSFRISDRTEDGGLELAVGTLRIIGRAEDSLGFGLC